MTDLISVIIPTYCRKPELLKRAMESVITQTYTNWELIVVDDSPEDYSERMAIGKLVESYHEYPIIYVQHEKSQGGAKARNTGIQYAHGSFIAFLDDDDEWFPEKLEKQHALMCDEKVGLVYCREYIVDSTTLEKTENIRNYKRGWVYPYLITDNFIGGNSFVLIRKKALDECGVFADIKSAQDAELFLRISKKYKVDYVDEPLLNYYINHGDRITTNPYNKINGFEYINQKHRGYLCFHPGKYAIRLGKLLSYYQVTNSPKYQITIVKMIVLAPWRLRQNLNLLIQLYYANKSKKEKPI